MMSLVTGNGSRQGREKKTMLRDLLIPAAVRGKILSFLLFLVWQTLSMLFPHCTIIPTCTIISFGRFFHPVPLFRSILLLGISEYGKTWHKAGRTTMNLQIGKDQSLFTMKIMRGSICLI